MGSRTHYASHFQLHIHMTAYFIDFVRQCSHRYISLQKSIKYTCHEHLHIRKETYNEL